MKAKALYHLNINQSTIKNIELAETEKGLIVQSLFSMISTGTELKVAKGEIGNDFAKAMAVPYMEGSFTLPIKYGYSLVGQVKSEGDLQNKIVHLLHPHQNICSVKAENVTPVPDQIPPLRAALTSNIETVVNAIWDSELQPEETAIVCGFGNIGSLLAATLRHHFKIKVMVLEKNEWRIKQARNLGFSVNESIQTAVAFHTTGTEQGLQTCIDLLEKEGKVIELSWYGNQKVNLQLGHSFHYDRKQIVSSQVSSIPKKMQAQWDFAKRKQYVFELLESDIYDAYISPVIPFEESAAFFNDLRNLQNPNGLIWCIQYSDSINE